MSVLILFENSINPEMGGVERVYANLTPYFRENGIEVYAYYFIETPYDNNHCYNGIYKGTSKTVSRVYKDLLYLVYLWRVNKIICGFPSYSLMKSAEKLPNIMVYHHIHNIPSFLFDCSQHSVFKRLHLNNFFTIWLSHFYIHIKFLSIFKRIVDNGHYVILLSNRYKDDFYSLYRIPGQKVISIPNPFLIDYNFKIKDTKKEKILLYVGRLTETQKNVSSLLRIWKLLQEKLFEYRLIILGDGPAKQYYESMIRELGLQRCTLTGFQSPTEYYKKSSVLLMTSTFEGFPMVLIEAMQYGCVPFAYNSFGSLLDIIKHGKNGFVITPFDENEYADQVMDFLSKPEDFMNKLREAAVETAKHYDINIVGEEWIKLFEEC